MYCVSLLSWNSVYHCYCVEIVAFGGIEQAHLLLTLSLHTSLWHGDDDQKSNLLMSHWWFVFYYLELCHMWYCKTNLLLTQVQYLYGAWSILKSPFLSLFFPATIYWSAYPINKVQYDPDIMIRVRRRQRRNGLRLLPLWLVIVSLKKRMLKIEFFSDLEFTKMILR